jgi:hypothetical protein
MRHITTFLCLAIPDSTSALSLTVILNSKASTKKHKNAKYVALNSLQKELFVYNMRSETKKSRALSCATKAGNMVWVR